MLFHLDIHFSADIACFFRLLAFHLFVERSTFIFPLPAEDWFFLRKPILFYFNNQAGFSIGNDLGVNYILAVLTDLSGKRLWKM